MDGRRVVWRHGRRGSGCSYYPELRAIVHCDEAPAGLLEELPQKYSSCFSVVEFFRLYDRAGEICACELLEPRHVIAFTREGQTVRLLNRLIDIEAASLDRVAAAIFRAHPTVREIRAEVKFPPDLLDWPMLEHGTSEDFVIDLPGSVEEYRASLGRRTRQNINQYTNRLARACPDFTVTTLEGGRIPFELVEQVAAWNRARIEAKGDRWIYEGHPEKLRRLWRLLRVYGLAVSGEIDGRCVASQLVLHVGLDTWVHTVGFDSSYEDVRLGLLMAYQTVVASIERGCHRMHMLWGTPVYKERLGAEPVLAHQLSLFRTPLDRSVYVNAKHGRDDIIRLVGQARRKAGTVFNGVLSDDRAPQARPPRPAG